MRCREKPLFWLFGVRELGIGLLVGSACCCFGQAIRLDSAGARFGFSATGAGRNFHQAEGFVSLDLPWDWDLGSRWHLQSRLEASAGWLGEPHADAAIAALGPSLSLGRHGWPVSLEAGISPTVLSRSDFPSKNLGTLFQFTSHVGINADVSSRIRLGYRFQHMSNADLSRHNPGLNLNMFAVSFLF